jgi:hypothetical protein
MAELLVQLVLGLGQQRIEHIDRVAIALPEESRPTMLGGVAR